MRVITFQCCDGFCYISTWFSHRYTYIYPLSLESPSPSHPSGWSWSTRFGLPVSYGKFPLAVYFTYSNMFVSMYSLKSSTLSFTHPCPKAYPLCLHRLCCPANKIISTIFLDFIYMVLIYNIYPSLSNLTSLCIIGSRFIHFIRIDSNVFLFIANQYSIVYMFYYFFIHSSINGHLTLGFS